VLETINQRVFLYLSKAKEKGSLPEKQTAKVNDVDLKT